MVSIAHKSQWLELTKKIIKFSTQQRRNLCNDPNKTQETTAIKKNNNMHNSLSHCSYIKKALLQ